LFLARVGLVACLLAASAILRLHGVVKNGIIGSDTFQYWDIALLWKSHHYVLNNDTREFHQFFRPIFYALNLLSLHLFGVRDYSLRALIGIADVINVGLVVLVGWVFFHNFVLAILVAVCYATTPSAILLSQIELPHTYSVTFVLLMFLAWLLVHRKGNCTGGRPYRLIAASGLFGGCAAATHGSTTFLAPPMVMLLVLNAFFSSSTPVKHRTLHAIREAAAFTAGFAVPYIFGGALVGYVYMSRALFSEATIRSPGDINRLRLLWTYLSEGPRASMSPCVAYLAWAGAALILRQGLRSRRLDLVFWSPLLILLGYSVLFSLVFGNVFYPRLYLPLDIFLLLVVFTLPRTIGAMWGTIAGAASSLAVTSTVVFYTFTPQLPDIMRLFRGQSKGTVRAVYDAIGDRVGEHARLLVAPYVQWVHRPSFKVPVYFGDTMRYLLECREGTLDHFVTEEQVRYIFISKEIDATISAHPVGRYAKIGACTGMTATRYEMKTDIAEVQSYLTKHRARQMSIDAMYGELYELSEGGASYG
jgi:hypothetical protein